MSMQTDKKSEWRQLSENNEEKFSLSGFIRNPNNAPDIQVSKKTQNYYFRLAEESPHQIKEDSDSSTYNSDNLRETDICRDSSDTESRSSSGNTFEAIEVLEFEVASASETEEFYSNDSSTGSDDFLFAFVATLSDTSTDNLSDFADVEDSNSDNCFDNNLSTGKNWVCLRCKKTQNNPKYCEKCYQVRKALFPPRPRRPSRKKKTSPYLETISVKNDNYSKMLKPNLTKNNGNVYNSGSETSDEDDLKNLGLKMANSNRKSIIKQRIINESTNISSSDSKDLDNFTKDKFSANKLNKKRRLNINEDCIDKKRLCGNLLNIRRNIIGDSDSSIGLNHLNFCFSDKDSGINSAQSSQEPTSSLLYNHKSLANEEYLINSSQETVLGELDDKDIEDFQSQATKSDDDKNSNINSLKVLNENVSYSSLISSSTECTDLGISNLSKIKSNTREISNFEYRRNKNEVYIDPNIDITNTGLCIICLTEPKNGVFVHNTFGHLCCCYKCAVKIYNKQKRCPICNNSAKNVMKIFVH